MTNTYEKLHPICSTCGHVNSFESWEMICPTDKTYKTREVLTFTESGYYVK
jgi:ribosomal protein L32